eukprot:snap_masked-scaffold_97-processed-gene-0.6-mRNA-1 protein AED:1.00 eAED:1.00 QI:0/-1/0/0/-1/1/1/0/256
MTFSCCPVCSNNYKNLVEHLLKKHQGDFNDELLLQFNFSRCQCNRVVKSLAHHARYCNLASTAEDRRLLETSEEALVFQDAPDSGLEEYFLSGNSSQSSESLAQDLNHHHLSSQNESSESTFSFTRFDHLLTVLKNEDPSSKDLNDAFEFLVQLPRKESSLNISESKLFLKNVNLLCNSYNQGPSPVKLFRLLCSPKLAFNSIITKNKLGTLRKFSTEFPHKLDASLLHSAFNAEFSPKQLDLKTKIHHLLKLKKK